MSPFTLHRRLLITCVAILAIAVAVGGCFGGVGTGTFIKGHVTEIDLENALRFEAGLLSSGPGVSGAQVTLVGPESHVITTDSFGRFTFANVAPGTYKIMVQKSGFASATAYDVSVASYRTNEVELRMAKPKEGSYIYETNPPTVYVSCLSPVVGTGYIKVSASDISGITGILLFIDNSYVELLSAGETYQWNTLSGTSVADNGEHTITAMAIDGYGNIGHMSIIVTVDNFGQPDPIPQTPTNLKAGAVTVHYSVFDLIHQLETKYALPTSSSLANEILSLAKSVQETDSQIRPLAMPVGSNAVTYCRVSWENVDPSIKGFKIYRDGVFIGESPAQSSGTQAQLIQPRPPDPPDIGSYIDGSSKLTPNVPVSYRVSAYNNWGEGNKSSSASTTPLGALKGVSLYAPKIQSGNTVQFTWSPVTSANLYVIFLVNEFDGKEVWEYSTSYNGVQVDLSALRSQYGDNYSWYVLGIRSIPGAFASLDPETWSSGQVSVSASELGYFEFPPR